MFVCLLKGFGFTGKLFPEEERKDGDAFWEMLCLGSWQRAHISIPSCVTALSPETGSITGMWAMGAACPKHPLPHIPALCSLLQCLQHILCHCGGLSGSNLLK